MTEHIVSMENVAAVVTLRPRVLRRAEACRYIGVGATKLFAMIRDGEIEALRDKGGLLVTVESLDAWLDALPKLAPRGKEGAP
jgi:excisionase family DNA binding protein